MVRQERVDERAALVGLIAGLAIMTIIKFETNLAWPWFALFGVTATFLYGSVAAEILPPATSPDRQEAERG